MNCEAMRELILTDYIDGEMDAKRKIFMEGHLAACPGCKEFSAAAKETAVEPFLDAARVGVPGSVWRRVEEKIASGSRKKAGLVAGLLERIRYVFYIPNPAVVLATVLTLVLIFGAVTRLAVNRYESLKAGRQAEVEYSAYLAETPAELTVSEEAGFGTAIEQYFL